MIHNNVTKRTSKTIVELEAAHTILGEQLCNGMPKDINELLKAMDRIEAAIRLQIAMLMQDNQIHMYGED